MTEPGALVLWSPSCLAARGRDPSPAPASADPRLVRISFVVRSVCQTVWEVETKEEVLKLNRKDLNSAELETVRVCRNPTKVISANGEVQTNGEGTVYVKDFVIRDSTVPRRYTAKFCRLDNSARIFL